VDGTRQNTEWTCSRTLYRAYRFAIRCNIEQLVAPAAQTSSRPETNGDVCQQGVQTFTAGPGGADCQFIPLQLDIRMRLQDVASGLRYPTATVSRNSEQAG
jgi:hypothetical protein